VAVIEERSGRIRRRVLVADGREEWYRSRFAGQGLFHPGRACPDAVVMSDRGGRLVVRLPGAVAPRESHPPPGAAEPAAGLVLKEETYRFPACLVGLVGPSRAESEFRNLAVLRGLGFPAVEPVACGRSGTWMFPGHTFLITREFAGAKSLKIWSREGGVDVTPADVERALLAFAGDVARLHRQGCYMRTLYGKNILLRRGAAGGAELAVCDVPRLYRIRPGRVRFGLAARDLACLEKWAADVYPARARLAFLRRYLEEAGSGPDARRWARRIRRERDRMQHVTPVGRLSHGVKRGLKRLGLGRWWPF
jgi:hypothetical protein